MIRLMYPVVLTIAILALIAMFGAATFSVGHLHGFKEGHHAGTHNVRCLAAKLNLGFFEMDPKDGETVFRWGQNREGVVSHE